jgi:shikimate 5-dehydrogenase
MTEAIQAAIDTHYPPTRTATIYFVGVTTGSSAIMDVFPRWADYLELGNVAIRGIDCQLHDQTVVYRRVIEFIKRDPLAKGALVTTHKIDLLNASRDMFDYLDPDARLIGEISCISKRDGKLRGHAMDPLTSGLALEAFLPERHWEKTGGEVFCIGAGGSAIAITTYLMNPKHGANRPSRIILANRSTARWEEIKAIGNKLGNPLPLQCEHTRNTEENDAIMSPLKPNSLVINATGLGKDAPGSPLTGAGRFPKNSFAWDLNYRGDLIFLDQARAQAGERQLTVVDGWVYFIHGWTRVIAEVFDVAIPTSGPEFDELSNIALEARSWRKTNLPRIAS